MQGTVKCIAEYGYDPEKVIRVFNDIQYLQDKHRALRIAVEEKQKDLARLDMQNSSVLQAISLHEDKLSVHNELDNIGCGSAKLKRLHDKIINITNSNNINYWLAVDKFFRDVETQYDSKLGLRKEKLNTQIRILEEEREKGLENFRILPFVGPCISRLMQRGLTENDIVKFSEVYLNILNKSLSVHDMAYSMLKTVEVITTRDTGTTSDDKSMEILGILREELSKLVYT